MRHPKWGGWITYCVEQDGLPRHAWWFPSFPEARALVIGLTDPKRQGSEVTR